MENLKKKFHLKFERVHRESLDAENDAIAQEWRKLRDILKSYVEKDIFNADKFCPFFRQLLGWTLCHKSKNPSGFKNDKMRLTCLTCCIMTGEDRVLLMIIGKSERPSAFNRKYGWKLGFDYHHNGRAWMNQGLFFPDLQVSTT